MSDDRKCPGHQACPYDETLIRELHAETAVQGTKIAGIEQGVKDIKQSLIGNGKPGVVVRLDRLEQKDKARAKILWIVVGSLVALAGKTIAAMFGIMK